MFTVNKKVEYALIALKHMAQIEDGILCSVKEICEQYKAPFDVTSRSMQQMASHGILKSEKGVNGGYRVSQDLNEISMLSLVEILLGSVHVAKCLPGDGSSCKLGETCNLINPMMKLDSRLRQFLESVTVGELLDNNLTAVTVG